MERNTVLFRSYLQYELAEIKCYHKNLEKNTILKLLKSLRPEFSDSDWHSDKFRSRRLRHIGREMEGEV